MIARYAGGESGARGAAKTGAVIIVVDAFRASTTIAVLVWKSARVVPVVSVEEAASRRDGLPHRGTGQREGRGLRFRQLADGDPGLRDTAELHGSPLDHERDPHRGGSRRREDHLYRHLRQRRQTRGAPNQGNLRRCRGRCGRVRLGGAPRLRGRGRCRGHPPSAAVSWQRISTGEPGVLSNAICPAPRRRSGTTARRGGSNDSGTSGTLSFAWPRTRCRSCRVSSATPSSGAMRDLDRPADLRPRGQSRKPEFRLDKGMTRHYPGVSEGGSNVTSSVESATGRR